MKGQRGSVRVDHRRRSACDPLLKKLPIDDPPHQAHLLPMERLRLLLVDENADDAFIIDRALRRAGFDPRCDRVATPEALQTAMSASDDYDVILCDSCGLRLALNVILPAAHAACPRTPILVVSSRHESEFRRAMARDQVAGFVSKEHLEDIPAAIAFLRSAPRENYASG